MSPGRARPNGVRTRRRLGCWRIPRLAATALKRYLFLSVSTRRIEFQSTLFSRRGLGGCETRASPASPDRLHRGVVAQVTGMVDVFLPGRNLVNARAQPQQDLVLNIEPIAWSADDSSELLGQIKPRIKLAECVPLGLAQYPALDGKPVSRTTPCRYRRLSFLFSVRSVWRPGPVCRFQVVR
jgi:hypothetical protein